MIIGFDRAATSPCNYRFEYRKMITEALSTSDDIKKQVEIIKDASGIVAAHLTPLQRIASELNCIIAIRPVDKLATELIEAGYPTKDFHIKGKSASWGAQAGLICVDQQLSKLENSSIERIDKFNHQIEKCIANGNAVAVPLVVAKTRLQSLLLNGAIKYLSLENKNGIIQFQSEGPSGKFYDFDARRLSGSGETTYLVFHQDKIIEVLAPGANQRPFTADYDLLFIAPHISDLGSQDNRHEDSETGLSSERIRQVIAIINNELVGDGEKVIHHSVDAYNPVTELAANYPATFALPERIGHFNELCIIKNNEEMKELVTEAKRAGYHMMMNPLWVPELVQIRRPSFEEARFQLISKLPGIIASITARHAAHLASQRNSLLDEALRAQLIIEPEISGRYSDRPVNNLFRRRVKA